MDTVFDEQAMRALISAKGLTIEGWAKALGISKVTLYRKMSGESDFWRKEIQDSCTYTGESTLDVIFFAHKVT